VTGEELFAELERLLEKIRDEAGREGLDRAARILAGIEAEGRKGEGKSWPGRFGMIGASQAMKKVWSDLEKVIDSDLTVLVTGESGTGKELVARALHDYGPRKGKPFVATNCAAIPETLLEGELFGHVRGAFTGAVKDRPGRFEEAHGGTLFLDEIGEMSPSMQSKLLRVLQDGEVRRVGSNKVRKVDVRVVAATNRDLARAVREGRFREDLFYRLQVFPIHLPPLREREDDALLLARYFLEEYTKDSPGKGLELSEGAVRAIRAHSWPGNVREVQNALRRAVALAGGSRIEAEDLGLASGDS